MADNTSPGGKASWREGIKTGPGAAPAKKSKGKQIFFVLATILFLVGILLALLLVPKTAPRPTFLPISVTQYVDKHIPVNAQGDDDTKALATEDFFGSQLTKGYTIQERDQIIQEFGNLKKKNKDEAVVVSLWAHAVPDAKGDLYLLPARAVIDKPDSWISLQSLLEGLKECPAQKKLLIIDMFRPVADPRLGLLANDAAARLAALLDKIPDENRLVLAACAPGQTSFSSEDLRQSVFGYYLEEGLQGWADGYGSKGKDGRVTVDELARFVRARVDRWVRRNRDSRQTPTLYGSEQSARAFELVAKAQPTPMPASGAVDSYPEWLQYGWQLRDLWWNDKTFQITPRTFRQLDAALLRDEQLWRGGIRTDELRTDLESQLLQFKKEVDKAWRSIPRPETPRSLALAAALPRPGDVAALDEARRVALAKAAEEAKAAAEKAAAEKSGEKKEEKAPPPPPKKPADDPGNDKAVVKFDPAANVDALRKLLNRVDELRGLEQKEAGKQREAQFKEYVTRFKDRPPFDLAWTVFEAAVLDVTPRADRIRFLNELLILGEQKAPLFTETLLLRRLGELAEAQLGSDPPPWPAEPIRRALQVARDGERAHALDPQRSGGWEPRALPWLRTLLDSASQKRHDAEVQLFNPGFGSAQKATDLFREAADEYQKVLGYLEALQTAFRVCDEALVYLPDLAQALVRQEVVDPRDQKNWQEAITNLIALHRLLNEGAASGTTAGVIPDKVSDVQQRAVVLRGQLDSLLRPFAADLAATIEKARRSDGAPSLWPEVETALLVPFVEQKQRRELWTASRLLAARLNERTRALDLEEATKDRQTDAGSEPEVARATAQEARRAAWRAQVALDLLRLGGLNGTDKLAAEVADAVRDPAKVGNWASLGDQIRRAWGEEGLIKQLRDNTSPPDRDRLSRVAHPFDESESLSDADAHPRLTLHRRLTTDFWAWLLDQTQYALQEVRGLRLTEENRPGDMLCQEFYERLRDDYQRIAGDKPANRISAELSSKSNRPQFPPGGGTQAFVFQILLDRVASKPELDVVAESPDLAWMQLEVGTPPTARGGETAFEAALNVRIPRDAGETGTPRPRGFLVGARLNGRSFHQRVPVGLPTPDNQRLQLLLSKSLQKPDDATGTKLRLRPNTRQSIYVFVRNPTKLDKNVTVEVMPKGDRRSGSWTPKPVVVKGGEAVQIPLESISAAPPAPKQEDSPLPKLNGPLVILLKDADNKGAIIEERTLELEVQPPREYVRVSKMEYLPGQKNRLRVTVQATEPIVGKPCRVRLDLPKDRIDGLVRAKGSFESQLDGEVQEIDLTAEDLEFDNRLTQRFPGFFYLHVDGYERAFIYRATFVTGTIDNPPLPEEHGGREVRVIAPDVMRPNTPIEVKIEVDNAPGVNLVVEQKRAAGGKFVQVGQLDGDRWIQRGFSPVGADGAFQVETRVSDWRLENLDVRGLRAPWDLRVRMFQGRVLLPSPPVKTIIVDDTPPEGVRITDLGGKPVPSATSESRPFTVLAAGPYKIKAEGRDPESKIKEVYFFLGQPEEGARPPKVRLIPADSQDEERTIWGGQVTVQDSREVQRISVEYTNGAGVPSFDTLYVQVVPKVADAKEGQKPMPKNGIVRGKVTENDRGQNGIRVLLRDLNDPMAKPRSANSNAQGQYLFDEVKPGSYQVEAYKDGAIKPNASEKTNIQDGDTRNVDLPLSF